MGHRKLPNRSLRGVSELVVVFVYASITLLDDCSILKIDVPSPEWKQKTFSRLQSFFLEPQHRLQTSMQLFPKNNCHVGKERYLQQFCHLIDIDLLRKALHVIGLNSFTVKKKKKKKKKKSSALIPL